MPAGIYADIESRGFRREMDTVMRHAGNMRRPFRAVGEYMLDSIVDNFKAQGRPVRWKPSKRAILQHGETLQDTGVMRTATFYIARARELILQNPMRYASYMQYGTRRNPARRFIMFQDVDRRRILQIISKHLRGE